MPDAECCEIVEMAESNSRRRRIEHIARPHRYCLTCGIELDPRKASSKFSLLLCGSCQQPLATGPVPAVGVAVVESGRVLLVRRRYAPMVGSWAIPSGFIEGSESPESTARRELEEETGLKVRLAGLLGAFRGGGLHGRILFLCFRGVVVRGKLAPGDDASDAGFFSLWNLPEPFAVGPHPEVVRILKEDHSTLEQEKRRGAE